MYSLASLPTGAIPQAAHRLKVVGGIEYFRIQRIEDFSYNDEVLTELNYDWSDNFVFTDNLSRVCKGIYFNGRGARFCGCEANIEVYSSNDQVLTELCNE